MAGTTMDKPLDGAGLSVVNGIINDRLNKKANSADIPTKTSQLANDSGYITGADVPEGAAASATVPKMDGTAAAGTETAFAGATTSIPPTPPACPPTATARL